MRDMAKDCGHGKASPSIYQVKAPGRAAQPSPAQSSSGGCGVSSDGAQKTDKCQSI